MTETPVIQRVRGIVESIASDLDLDLYDLEQRGSTLRVTGLGNYLLDVDTTVPSVMEKT